MVKGILRVEVDPLLLLHISTIGLQDGKIWNILVEHSKFGFVNFLTKFPVVPESRMANVDLVGGITQMMNE